MCVWGQRRVREISLLDEEMEGAEGLEVGGSPVGGGNHCKRCSVLPRLQQQVRIEDPISQQNHSNLTNLSC